jgi:hypothetical protein
MLLSFRFGTKAEPFAQPDALRRPAVVAFAGGGGAAMRRLAQTLADNCGSPAFSIALRHFLQVTCAGSAV